MATTAKTNEGNVGPEDTVTAKVNSAEGNVGPEDEAGAKTVKDGNVGPKDEVKTKSRKDTNVGPEDEPPGNGKRYAMEGSFALGDTILHTTFGQGRVSRVIPRAETCGACQLGQYGDPAKIEVKFENAGEKTLVQNLRR